jgi:hypothetical protein
MPYDDIKSSMRSNSIIDRLLAGPIVSHTWPWMAFMKIVRTKPNGNLCTEWNKQNLHDISHLKTK